jgi:hypothetical protein
LLIKNTWKKSKRKIKKICTYKIFSIKWIIIKEKIDIIKMGNLEECGKIKIALIKKRIKNKIIIK